MLPIFPNFKNLEITDKPDLEKITAQFPPYSDFNFVSLWSYNTLEDFQLSLLNGNLVLRMNDYITLEPFYTFIGIENVTETIRTLLQFSQDRIQRSELRVIPEIDLSKDAQRLHAEFDIFEDRDCFDYIYSLDLLVAAEGGQYKVLRNMLSKFVRTVSSYSLTLVDLQDENVQQQIIELIHVWGAAQGREKDEIENELNGVKRLLDSSQYLNLICLCLYIEDHLKAFFISEKTHDEYAMAHFRKADPSFPGIFQFIDYENAKYMKLLGCKFLNYEQDLGIPNLVKSKQSLHPVKYLKKYKITLK